MLRCVAGLIGAGIFVMAADAQDAAPDPGRWGVVIHGGAGVIERGVLSEEEEVGYRAALAGAAEAAGAILAEGGSSLDAVETAIRLLEDDPRFNAGRGAVFTAEGVNELDASIMDGSSRAAGAVAGVTTVANPITLARAVMEQSPHVMMARDGAEAFAVSLGMETVAAEYFYTERRWRQLQTALSRGQILLDHERFGTVGAVALDQAGHLAAGTSTGGMTAKLYGRVGDSPVIGAGTYADDASCAVSATGHGEFFIRAAVARTICARVEFLGEDLQTAADAVVREELVAMGGDGGVIAVDPSGALVWSFNSPGMYRARFGALTPLEVAIYEDAAVAADDGAE